MSNKVINFHDVYDGDWLKNTLSILINKYNIVDIKEVEDYFYNGKKLNNSCHITIDDGDKTFYQVIYPVLKKLNVPATIFVSPRACLKQENFWFQEIADFDEGKLKLVAADCLTVDAELLSSYSIFTILKNLKLRTIWDIISKYKVLNNITKVECRNMSVEQLIDIDKDGLVTIGAHTMNHPILANEDIEFCQFEIEKSFDELEQILGHKINYFAYPNGEPKLDFSEREKIILKEKNCLLSFSTSTQNFNGNIDVLSIPRYGFSFGNNFFIKSKLFFGSYWKYLKYLKGKSEKDLRLELKLILKNNGKIDSSLIFLLFACIVNQIY